MNNEGFKPYVPEETQLKELSIKALVVGVILAIVLGAANAYVGLRAGMTVAATFPAAVVAMAVLRIFKGSILEENIARTTASVGEALVAGAIFTIPAFVIAGVWDGIKYWQSTAFMLAGGILGVLFVIILRRPIVHDKELKFPESVACGEIVKAGQKGATGASYVFSAAGFAAFIELIKNSHGIQIINEYVNYFKMFGESKISMLQQSLKFKGGVYVSTPSAAPLYLGVGYIIGPRLSAIVFSGGVFGWLLLIPLFLFANTSLSQYINLPDGTAVSWQEVGYQVWLNMVRPVAVGAMILSALYTLYRMRKTLLEGIGRAVKDTKSIKAGTLKAVRLEQDLDLTKIIVLTILMVIPISIIYIVISGDVFAGIVAGIIMTVAGFLFAAVAGYLVGLIGSSNNPISGLTVSTLLIAAVLMVILGVKGTHGIGVVLGVATVVCCSCGIAGDMMQDLKVGHILGGTPKKMQIGEIIGVIFAAVVMVLPLSVLHMAYGLGSEALPAPQAGLMALVSKGIVSGEMAWPLVFAGIFMALGLIMVKAPSPMLIAVGMYLPFHTTAAIFVGGIIKFIFDKIVEAKKFTKEQKQDADNKGILISSGLIAGESLTAIILAFLFIAKDRGWISFELPRISENFWLGLIIFPLTAFILWYFPLRKKAIKR
ncbi:oligopeptide transporter, OPT family [candidate division KSB1 bacterium]|nr:MAG: oligopeptide transporter, OPT family [candidate division KSB1 bacterium]